MPPPLSDGQVTYDDGSPQTVAQYAKDVTAFLMWAAEPHMEARKRIGFQVMIFLLVLARPALLHQEEGLGAVKAHRAAEEERRRPNTSALPACAISAGHVAFKLIREDDA